MTLQELKQKKTDLESGLKSLIDKFEQETEAQVNHISYYPTMKTLDGKKTLKMLEVEIAI